MVFQGRIMAISLDDVNVKTSGKLRTLLDIILERKEQKLRSQMNGESIKKRVLRPWESFNDLADNRHYTPKKRKTIMQAFKKNEVILTDEEKMARRIRVRAEELFSNVEFF
jgi:hypothetical protein